MQAPIITPPISPALAGRFFFKTTPATREAPKPNEFEVVISQSLRSQSDKIHKWKQNKPLILGPKVSLSFTEVKVLFYLKGKKCEDSCFLTQQQCYLSPEMSH